MPGVAYEALYEIAEEQYGYLTTAQARERGVSKQAVHQMVRRGDLERVSWGLYRLVHFPRSSHDHHVEAMLWPLSVRGVVSHESALALYGLSHVNPAEIHITVPRSFRLQREVAKALVIHRVALAEAEIGYHEGIPVTTPERAIRDCHATHLGPALVRQAIEGGRRTGLLRRSQVQALMHELLGEAITPGTE
jgi:predicted transcriptional regulator of viral defense system